MFPVFELIPSRRLGRSLGINNIPPKVCSYSCVYCQLGRTKRMDSERRGFYDPGELVRAVRALLSRDGADWLVVERPLSEGKLVQIECRGTRFLLRRPGPSSS